MAPNDAFAWEQLGRAEFRAGNFKAALVAFNKGEGVRPCQDSSALSMRAAVRSELGQTSAAWDDVKR